MDRTTAGSDEARRERHSKAARARKRQKGSSILAAMAVTAGSIRPRGFASLLSGPRLLLAVGVPALFGLLLSLPVRAPATYVMIGHAVAMGLTATLTFGLLEQNPKRLPSWLPRWILQLVGVVAAVPVGVLIPHVV